MLNSALPARRKKKIDSGTSWLSRPTLWAYLGFFVWLCIFQICDRLIFSHTGHYLLNEQIILGMVLNNTWSVLLSVAMSGVWVLAGIYWLKLPRYLVILALAGAVSNIIDRICFGGVVDYINFFGWFTVNASDIAICVAITLACSYLLLSETKKRPA